MFSDARWHWLLFEGIIPLFGAGFLYLAWGGVRRITAMSWSTSSYAWKETIDPMGWLYGALITVLVIGILVAGFNAQGLKQTGQPTPSLPPGANHER
jgi:hypothetical protein